MNFFTPVLSPPALKDTSHEGLRTWGRQLGTFLQQFRNVLDSQMEAYIATAGQLANTIVTGDNMALLTKQSVVSSALNMNTQTGGGGTPVTFVPANATYTFTHSRGYNVLGFAYNNAAETIRGIGAIGANTIDVSITRMGTGASNFTVFVAYL